MTASHFMLPERPRAASLSTRIVTVSLLALVVVLGMVGGTLWLSWQLEGGAAAINEAGSLRMRAYRLMLAASSADDPLELPAELARFEASLLALERGDPARPLLLPAQAAIRAQFAQVQQHWQGLRAQLLATPPALRETRSAVDELVQRINQLVSMVEQDNARKTTWLRLSQAVLIAIAIVGTVAMIYLLYLWIVRPVLRLQEGVRALAARNFATRVPVETDDEFGALAFGFNAMASELEVAYADLERRVQQKTAQLATQNRELGMLYEMADFLAHPEALEAQCRGFLQRVLTRFGAEGASLRVLDPEDERLHLVVAEGLSAAQLDSPQCLRAHECLCGSVVAGDAPVVWRDLRSEGPRRVLECARNGFNALAVFRIASPQGVLGSYALHFREDPHLSAADSQLLETLGMQLGTVLENARLAARQRLLAVGEERKLMAQGLHDSLAQSLNFLNLQVQMLDKALQQVPHPGAARILPLLQTGVRESYEDVRELLANFRTRLENAGTEAVLQTAVARFREQAGLPVSLAYEEAGGPPLADEEKLQLLFIVQEALSNVRKHAAAGAVSIQARNAADFTLEVRDDGCGFTPAQGEATLAHQVGLHIMQERAARIHAQLQIESAPGAGSCVRLRLPQAARSPV